LTDRLGIHHLSAPDSLKKKFEEELFEKEEERKSAVFQFGRFTSFVNGFPIWKY